MYSRPACSGCFSRARDRFVFYSGFNAHHATICLVFSVFSILYIPEMGCLPFSAVHSFYKINKKGGRSKPGSCVSRFANSITSSRFLFYFHVVLVTQTDEIACIKPFRPVNPNRHDVMHLCGWRNSALLLAHLALIACARHCQVSKPYPLR